MHFVRLKLIRTSFNKMDVISLIHCAVWFRLIVIRLLILIDVAVRNYIYALRNSTIYASARVIFVHRTHLDHAT